MVRALSVLRVNAERSRDVTRLVIRHLAAVNIPTANTTTSTNKAGVQLKLVPFTFG